MEVRVKSKAQEVLRDGFSGCLAGGVAKTLVAPLDRVKILFQTSNPTYSRYYGRLPGIFHALRAIVSSEGSLGLYRGHWATLARIVPSAGTKFIAYEQACSVLIHGARTPVNGTSTTTTMATTHPWRQFVCGAFAGVSTTLIFYPLEVVRVRLAFQTGHSDTTSFRKIHNGTWTNFYRGLWPSLVGTMMYHGCLFLTRDSIQGYLHQPNTDQSVLLVAMSMLGNGVAGIVGQAVSYPLETIRRQIQVQTRKRTVGIWRTGVDIWDRRGWRGFFAGLSINVIRAFPAAMTYFLVYDNCRAWLGASPR